VQKLSFNEIPYPQAAASLLAARNRLVEAGKAFYALQDRLEGGATYTLATLVERMRVSVTIGDSAGFNHATQQISWDVEATTIGPCPGLTTMPPVTLSR